MFAAQYVLANQRVYFVPDTLLDRRILAFIGDMSRWQELADETGEENDTPFRRILRYIVNNRVEVFDFLRWDAVRNHPYVTARDWVLELEYPLPAQGNLPTPVTPNEEPVRPAPGAIGSRG